MGREEELEGQDPGAVGAVAAPGTGTAGPALKPRERSSGAARIVEEEEEAQSAKAPESEGNCLRVVATTDILEG